jgi:malate dehydrogenase (oxaloacetate-decarboxylating)
MAQHTRRPIIFPLSNPTERSEGTPQDLLAWTEDRAVVGTGSPFPSITRAGQPFRIDQVNNAYVFPGVGLGAIAIKARHISEGMFLAAARAIAACKTFCGAGFPRPTRCLTFSSVVQLKVQEQNSLSCL